MSNAKPMDPEKRAILYTEVTGPDGENAGWRRMTPRQQHRWRKKLRGDWGCQPDGEDYVPSFSHLPDAERPKRYRTLSRANAIRRRLNVRRQAEARRG